MLARKTNLNFNLQRGTGTERQLGVVDQAEFGVAVNAGANDFGGVQARGGGSGGIQRFIIRCGSYGTGFARDGAAPVEVITTLTKQLGGHLTATRKPSGSGSCFSITFDVRVEMFEDDERLTYSGLVLVFRRPRDSVAALFTGRNKRPRIHRSPFISV